MTRIDKDPRFRLNWKSALCAALVLASTVACGGAPTPTSEVTATPTAIPAATEPLTSLVTATPEPAPTPTSMPMPKPELSPSGLIPIQQGDIHIIENADIKYSDIIREKPIRLDQIPKNRLQVVIVGANFTNQKDLQNRMKYYATTMKKICGEMTGLPIDFAYLNESMLIGIGVYPNEQNLADYLNPNEPKILLEKIQKIYPAHGLIVVSSSKSYFGSGGEFPISSDDAESGDYIIAHEFAHWLGLEDVYRVNDLCIPTLPFDFFTSTQTINPTLRHIITQMDKNKVKMVDTHRTTCNGEKIYALFDVSNTNNLMSNWNNDKESVLEEYQIKIMQETIQKILDSVKK